MKMARGKVVSGKVVVEGERLEEGETVTVLIHDDEETFELDSKEEAELLRTLDDVDKGSVVDGDEFIRRHLS